MATKSDYRLGIALVENEGFATPNPDLDEDFDNGIIDPMLCNKITEIEDCPFNTARRACIDCDVIVYPDDLIHILNHIDFTPEED